MIRGTTHAYFAISRPYVYLPVLTVLDVDSVGFIPVVVSAVISSLVEGLVVPVGVSFATVVRILPVITVVSVVNSVVKGDV